MRFVDKVFLDSHHGKKPLIKKISPKVNMLYALGIIIEGISADLGIEELKNSAIKLRSSVDENSRKVSESFGDWSDIVEEKILSVDSKENLLPVLCVYILMLSRKIEFEFRKIEPTFNFYQKDAVNEIAQYSTGARPDIYKAVDKLLIRIMYE